MAGTYNLTPSSLASGTCGSANACSAQLDAAAYVISEANGAYIITFPAGTSAAASVSGDTVIYSASALINVTAACTTNVNHTISLTPNGTTAKGITTFVLTPPCDGSSNTSCQCVYNLTGTFNAQ